MLTVTDAQSRILTAAPSSRAVETVPLAEALGRVLAADVVAACAVPPCDNSAMDGYAVRVADVLRGGSLPVAGITYAGDAPAVLPPGQVQRIFTGAPVPVGADAIVIQEDVDSDGEAITLKPGVTVHAGENIRRAGEDIAADTVVLRAGQRLQAAGIGLLASVGCARVAVATRWRVGLLCTGDELRDPGEALAPGQIYNSNRFLLTALLQALGCTVVDAGRVADSEAATVAALRDLAARCDVVISTGGVSVGDADHVRAAVQALGTLDLWKIAVKPGKPLAFGTVGNTPFFGLPGNPVSAYVTFLLFVQPYLLRGLGCHEPAWRTLRLPAGFAWPRAGKREEYLRVQLQADAMGQLQAVAYPHQGSGVLSSVNWAHALLRVPAGTTFAEGDPVDCLLL